MSFCSNVHHESHCPHNEDSVTRYGIMLHIKDGDGNWMTPRMDRSLFDSYEEAIEDDRMNPAFSEFDREINDAFTAIVTITSAV